MRQTLFLFTGPNESSGGLNGDELRPFLYIWGVQGGPRGSQVTGTRRLQVAPSGLKWLRDPGHARAPRGLLGGVPSEPQGLPKDPQRTPPRLPRLPQDPPSAPQEPPKPLHDLPKHPKSTPISDPHSPMASRCMAFPTTCYEKPQEDPWAYLAPDSAHDSHALKSSGYLSFLGNYFRSRRVGSPRTPRTLPASCAAKGICDPLCLGLWSLSSCRLGVGG